jgi:sigma-B regulation protein RsbU (phosphoserine phosphatase)
VPPFGSNRSELDLLAGSFNAMAATLQERDRELRRRRGKNRKAGSRARRDARAHGHAKQIQALAAAEDPLAVGCVRYAGRCIPATAVGGDYFGYFPRAADGVDSSVGDVSGHGVGAALLMAEARTMFLAGSGSWRPAPLALVQAQRTVARRTSTAQGYFITACCAIFDAADARAELRQRRPPALRCC